MTDPHVPMERLKQDVTSITLVNNTAKTEDVTVPQGERWSLLSVKMANADDVDRVVQCDVYKEVAKTNLIKRLLYETCTANDKHRQWPCHTTATSGNTMGDYAPVILDAGNTLEFTWAAGGASAGAVDADGLVVEYLKVEI